MKKHIKIYLDFFGYNVGSIVLCEICGKQAVDVHHIEARGMGGKNHDADRIENLQAACRDCHLTYGDKKQYENILKSIHMKKIAQRHSEMRGEVTVQREDS